MSSAAATTHATSLPTPRARKRLGRGTLASMVLLAAVALGLGFLAGGAHSPSRAHARASAHVFTAGDRSFSVAVPAGWRASAIGKSAAVIERTDRKGVVLVREHPALRKPLTSLVKGLPRQLKRRFPDFKPVSASVARLSTGSAVVYTFVRTKRGTVQTIVIAPAARRSFTLEVVAPAGAHDAARQAGQIVRSLKAAR